MILSLKERRKRAAETLETLIPKSNLREANALREACDALTEDPLRTFIEQEVHFRLNEILETPVSPDNEEVIAEALYEDSDILFDYDRIDEWLENYVGRLKNDET